MTDVNNDDLARAANLLEIAERCTGHSGKLSSLQGWAIGQLIALNEAIRLDAVAKAQAEKDKTVADAAAQREAAAQEAIDADPEDDHQVDLNLGAPRANPPIEHGGNGRRL